MNADHCPADTNDSRPNSCWHFPNSRRPSIVPVPRNCGDDLLHAQRLSIFVILYSTLAMLHVNVVAMQIDGDELWGGEKVYFFCSKKVLNGICFVYRLVMAAVASDTDIGSLRYASKPFAYRIVAMDSNLIVAVNSNSYSIRLDALPANAVRLASAADSTVAVDCN